MIDVNAEKLRKKLRKFISGKSEAARVVRTLSDGPWHTYLFGGLVREICLPAKKRHIRYIDVVIEDEGFSAFEEKFRGTYQTNRFGGLQFRLDDFQVDAWKMSSTWAFREGHYEPELTYLPFTVFLNIDGLVAEVPRKKRDKVQLFAGPYFEASQSQILNICLEANPYTELSSVRAIRMLVRYKIHMARPLARYVSHYFESHSARECEEQLCRHYRRSVLGAEQLDRLAHNLKVFVNSSRGEDEVFYFSEQRYLPDFSDES